MNALYEVILARLQEVSTWTSIVVTVCTLLGVSLAPELKEAIVSTGLVITTLVLAIIKEKK